MPYLPLMIPIMELIALFFLAQWVGRKSGLRISDNLWMIRERDSIVKYAWSVLVAFRHFFVLFVRDELITSSLRRGSEQDE
jgi:hypothetical protein